MAQLLFKIPMSEQDEIVYKGIKETNQRIIKLSEMNLYYDGLCCFMIRDKHFYIFFQLTFMTFNTPKFLSVFGFKRMYKKLGLKQPISCLTKQKMIEFLVQEAWQSGTGRN
jgi:hypothetical protein